MPPACCGAEAKGAWINTPAACVPGLVFSSDKFKMPSHHALGILVRGKNGAAGGK